MIRYRSRGGFVPTNFQNLLPLISTRPPFLILDRDGTLVPLAATPKEAIVSTAVRNIVHDLAEELNGRIAIISARGLSTLAEDFDPTRLILAGNYGLEISFPDGHQFLHPLARQCRDSITAARNRLFELEDEHTIVDYHLYSLCVHLKPGSQAVLGTIDEFLAGCLDSQLRLKRLESSMEILPDVDWNKSDAADYIAARLHCSGQDVIYLAFGDSDSDEPVFSWVQKNCGIGFRVGENHKTQAMACVDTTDDVFAFLKQLSSNLNINRVSSTTGNQKHC